MADKIKLVLAFVFVVTGIAGFYVLHDSPAVARFAVVLLGFSLAVVVVRMTESGRRLFAFGAESVAEAKRVVWPSRKETVQTTGIVLLFAVVMALFLWAVDSGLLLVVNKLMGRT